MEEKKEKSNIIFLLFAIIFIIITLIVLVGAYGLYLNRPKNFFKTTINNKYLKFNDKKSKVFNFNPADNKLESNLKLNLEVSNKGVKSNQELIDFDYNSDVKNEYLSAAINSKLFSKIKTDVAFNENDLIINNNAIYEKPLLLNNEIDFDWTYLQNINEEDFDTITKTIKNEVIKSLKEKNFKTKNTTIKVDGHDIKAKKLTYVDKNANKTIDNIIANLANDDKFIKALANITGIDKKDIKNELKNTKVEEKLKPITINLYTTGLFSKLAKTEIEYDEFTLSYMNYKDSNYELKYSTNDYELVYSANINDDKEYDFTIKANKETIVKGIIKENSDEALKVNFEIIGKDNKINGKIDIKTVKDNNNELSKKGSIIIYTSDKKDDYYKLTFESTIKKVKKINKDNIKNAVDYNKLNKKEKAKIEGRLNDSIDAIKDSLNFTLKNQD